MLTILASGFVFGLAAGLAPGPLLMLVLSQSLRHGPAEGCKVALAPLLTDAPIILLAILLAPRVAEAQPVLGALSLAGGLFILYLALDCLRPPPSPADTELQTPRSWLKGSVTNWLSPHPWLFWATVGTPTLAKALSHGWAAAVGFLALFYLPLVGCKLALALVAGRSRRFLDGRAYRLILKSLAAFMVICALFFLREAWRLLIAV